jgi:metallo-beta-lactamase family protein
MTLKLKFLGATECVTGSKYLVKTEKHCILVDCGLFQGRKELRLRNWDKFPIDPSTINAVLLTHAHLDHCGYLPLLIKNGFCGKIYSTPATKDLCSILLPDSGYLQEELAYFANKHKFSKHKPALPLYTKNEAEVSLHHFKTINFGENFQLFDNFNIQFNRAGHILGAATILIKNQGQSILFSGDLGRPNDPIMRPPEAIKNTDYLIMESTYGDRIHEKPSPLDLLAAVINHTEKRGGTILIPSFAVGRAQTILYLISKLKEAQRIADIPIFLDSPMAIDATEIFLRYSDEHKLSAHETEQVCKTAKYINTVKESKELDRQQEPKIIISASGMAVGGRVLHHIKTFAPDSRNVIVFTGYQAEGTRGDILVRKHQREIKLLGEIITVNAEIMELENISAHADVEEIMLWLKNFATAPKAVFITHGEIDATHKLCTTITKKLNWQCIIPTYMEEVVLK